MTITQRKSPIPIKLILLLLIAWGILTIRLSAPWFGVQDAYRVWVASAVRNYDIYGVENTTLMVVRDSAPTDPEDFYIYSHHPPLIAWVPALFTELFGFHELGVRYGFVVVTLLSVCAMYVLTRRLYNEKMAFWAAGFYAFTPMVAYFGRVPGHDQLGLAAALLFSAVLVNWLRQPNRPRLLLLGILAWLAVWTAWPAVFFVGLLGISAMWVATKHQRIAIIGLGVVTIIAFAVMMGFYQTQWDESIDSLLDAFIWRSSDTSGQSNETATFTPFEFVGQIFTHTLFFSTPGLLALAFWGISPLRTHGKRFSNILVLGLFLAGVVYILTFRNASYIHDYYKVVFVPAIAISASAVIVFVRNNPQVHRWARPAIDACIGSSIVLSAIVIGISHLSGHQPQIEATINTLEAELQESDIVMSYFDFELYNTSTRYNNVIEFYTFHPLAHWQITPNDAINTASQYNNRVIYTYCSNGEDGVIPAILFTYDSIPIYEDQCRLFILNTGI